MIALKDMIQKAREDGYSDEDAEAKVCQDIVLKALSESLLRGKVTIKGGVVMRSISKNARRATQDMDIDFIRYSLSDESILSFVNAINCLEGIQIRPQGSITELKQQDYHGKRIHVTISDGVGDAITSKIDLGVHTRYDIQQEEYCFDIACFDDGANLLINSKEQMFTEKLRSLLKFGPNSTRYKDVYDMHFLSGFLVRDKLNNCVKAYIFDDPGMRENNWNDVLRRLSMTFSNRRYVDRLSRSRKNWLDMDSAEVLSEITDYIRTIL